MAPVLAGVASWVSLSRSCFGEKPTKGGRLGVAGLQWNAGAGNVGLTR